MNTTTGQSPSAEQLLERIGERVAYCYDELSSGRQVDLSGLDEDVSSLCETVAQLPAQESEELQPRMQELMGKLKDLGNKLEEARAEVKKQLAALNMRQKANKAYSTTPGQHTDKPGDDE